MRSLIEFLTDVVNDISYVVCFFRKRQILNAHEKIECVRFRENYLSQATRLRFSASDFIFPPQTTRFKISKTQSLVENELGERGFRDVSFRSTGLFVWVCCTRVYTHVKDYNACDSCISEVLNHFSFLPENSLFIEICLRHDFSLSLFAFKWRAPVFYRRCVAVTFF